MPTQELLCELHPRPWDVRPGQGDGERNVVDAHGYPVALSVAPEIAKRIVAWWNSMEEGHGRAGDATRGRLAGHGVATTSSGT